MALGSISRLVFLAVLAQAQANQGPPPSEIRPYTVETIRAGAQQDVQKDSPKAQRDALKTATVTRDFSPRVFERQGRVERGPCNMPIIVANAEIDPKMIVPLERKNADVKIRAVEPTTCGGLQQTVGVKR